MELTPEQKILKAKHRMMKHFPFFSFLLSYLKTKKADWLPYKTVATNGEFLFWDIDFIKSCTIEQVTFAFLHEVLHNAFRHLTRRGGRDINRWGAATDYAVNGIIVQQPGNYVQLPLDGQIYLDEKYFGMAAEQIYDLIPEGEAQHVFDFHMDGKNNGSRDEESKWRTRTHAAYIYSKKLNQAPVGLEEFIDQLTRSQVNWRTRLHQFANQFSRDDYSWARLNKMHIHRGFYLPGCYSMDLGDCVVAVDTSASVSSEQLSQFLAEVSSIKTTYPMNLHLIQSDDRVRSHHIFGRNEFPDKSGIKVEGRGSTSFVPAFDYLKEKGIIPKFMIYITDGKGAFPENPPGFPVLWVLTKDHESPPWGESVVLSI